jgi:hypothetical protein
MNEKRLREIEERAEAATSDEFVAFRREQVFTALREERAYQDDKWGTIEEHPHTVGEWLLIMEAELHEAKWGWVKEMGEASALAEILQVVAVGVACLEQHGIIQAR